MNKKERGKLEKYLTIYFKEIHQIYTDGDFREESFYPSFKQLVENCPQSFEKEAGINVLVVPRKTEAGIPDFRIGKNGEIIGYIEAKQPDTNLGDIEESEQLKRYRNSLPNLILTNFLEFRLYRFSKLVNKVEVGRQFTLRSLKSPPTPEKLDAFFEFLENFFYFSIPEIQNSSDLSIELAKKTRFLEHILQEELSRENDEVTRFYKAFQEELIETLTKERFADLYAQTITYGLFAARMQSLPPLVKTPSFPPLTKGGEGGFYEFNRETAWKSIPESLPLLKEIFYSMTGPHFPESLTWIVDDITQILEKADIKSILEEFKTTRWEEDPVIHFYETFLATYNPKERERLGVYYTPLPVVSYIVRSIDKLLRDSFQKSEGLATSDVTLLDPAAGTLTFVVQAIKQVKKELGITDMSLFSTKTKETTYIFPLYLYPEKFKRQLSFQDPHKGDNFPNFTPEFLQAIKLSLSLEATPEKIFYYIYAVLYSPTYRKRYEEFLKIDFPRVPLPSNKEIFEKLSSLGKELVELHLLKHSDLEKTEVGFPRGGSNKVEKIIYEEPSQKVFLNKEQYFEGIPGDMWEYRIGAYQVMDKYLKDRKGRKLSLDEINHYMKVAKAIRLTIELQKKIDDVPLTLL